MMARSLSRRLRAELVTFVMLGALCVLALALPSARAQAEELSGSALVEYSPQTWLFAISASGHGRVELVGVRIAQNSSMAQYASQAASPMIVVRDGTVELEVSEGQVLDFHLVPDEGASIMSVLVGGRDESGALDESGVLSLPAEEAQVDMEVVFSQAISGATSGGGALGGLVRTGDFLWIGSLALVAFGAFCAMRCAHRHRMRNGADEVPPHDSA